MIETELQNKRRSPSLIKDSLFLGWCGGLAYPDNGVSGFRVQGSGFSSDWVSNLGSIIDKVWEEEASLRLSARVLFSRTLDARILLGRDGGN